MGATSTTGSTAGRTQIERQPSGDRPGGPDRDVDDRRTRMLGMDGRQFRAAGASGA